MAHAPAKTTLYLGSTEIDEHTGGMVVGTRYYGATAVRTATGLKWVASDGGGTSIVQIDADTLQPERRRMMPYGEPRGTKPTWGGTKGYIGGTLDDTGLTHLGARYYDPTLGRFISVDPILNLDDKEQWHGYSYANNNPLTWTDPDGLMPICIDWCGSPVDKSVRAYQQATTTAKTTTTPAVCMDSWCRPGGALSAESKANSQPAAAGVDVDFVVKVAQSVVEAVLGGVFGGIAEKLVSNLRAYDRQLLQQHAFYLRESLNPNNTAQGRAWHNNNSHKYWLEAN
jgi:RHS repeat-associated protein